LASIIEQDNLYKHLTVTCNSDAEAKAIMDKGYLIGTMTSSYVGKNLYVYVYVADDVTMDEAIRMIQTVRIR